jgi:hypothetical protein
MPVLMLDELKGLFKDDASFRTFVQRLRDAMANNSMPLVLTDKEVLFTAISPEATHDMLCERIVNRLSENPALLDEIEGSLNDEIAD